MQFLSRMQNLLRGTLAHWLHRRERRNPEAVYESAIAGRREQYEKLRAAAAGVLYLRGKLAKDLEVKTGELSRLDRQLEVAVDRDDDTVALALIARRDSLRTEITRVESELADLNVEAETAKKNLIAFQGEIARLHEERVRMMARLANAKARLRFQETLSGLSPDADIRALEAVREHIHKLVAEVQVSRDLGDTDLEQRLGVIRAAEEDAAARAQLDELKRSRRRVLLPAVLPPSHAAA